MNIDDYIKRATERCSEIEKQLSNFNFGSEVARDEFQRLSREHQRLTKLSDLWKSLQKAKRELQENQELLRLESNEEMQEFISSEIQSLEKIIERDSLKIKELILPPDKNEDRNIIVEIRPAAGGDEAGLFAADLFRMYLRFAEKKRWKIEVLEQSMTGLGGVKELSFALKGEQVFRFMRYESGVHRVQRVPVTESGGRIHTSTITVAVLPEAEEVDVEIRNEDLRVDVYRSSGPGGQCVNTTDSAVRITHIPSGVVVSSQQEKSQHQNREIAMRILRSRLLKHKQDEEAAKEAAERRSQVGSGERSERIRTYNFPQSRISDHRFGITIHDLPAVLEGNLEQLLEEIIAIDVERRLEKEIGRDA